MIKKNMNEHEHSQSDKHHTEVLPVKGMHCASCASTIKRTLEKLDGVESCEVNYGTEKARIAFDPKKVSVTHMNSEIDKLGYELMHEKTTTNSQPEHGLHEGHDMMTPTTSDESVKTMKLKELALLKKNVTIVLPMIEISVFVMAWEIGAQTFGLLPEMPEIAMEFFHHLLPIFATYTLFVIGLPYLKGMIRFFRYGVANMDSLVGIGTSVAFLYSFIVSAFEGPLSPYIDVQNSYYDVTIVVIGLITLGKYLEARSKLKTGEAIEKLLELQAKKAIVIRNGQEIEVSIEEVIVGDVAIVKPGQKIPLDGTIFEGSSAIDESMITGESIPVDKGPGSSVIGGTINKQGFLKITITKVGSQTMLAQIITMVEQAQGSKAPIERLADSVSAIFVPVVLMLSVVVFFAWLVVGAQFLPFSEALKLGLLSFVGILVIACPCAMGLATPTAVIVGVGKAAQNGILIKNAETLEKFNGINFIVMDKTGTITKGTPELTDISVVDGSAREKVLGNIASLESYSEHPLAQAIVDKAKSENLPMATIQGFEAIEGKGLTGEIDGIRYYAGNVGLAEERNFVVDSSIIQKYASEGKTPIIFMDASKIIAYIAMADTVKDEAQETVSQLHKLGIKVAMLTGDNQQTAEYIASQVGIDRVMAQVLPADKAQKIQELQKEGYKVAMVGDGINDAPALATADVGIAMGTGTDVAIESAGVTLLGGKIAQIPKALQIARATMNIIKQNLFWAFFYNIVGIPIAAGALYPFFGIMLNPAIAGGAMGMSSVSVVLNSLRLKAKKF